MLSKRPIILPLLIIIIAIILAEYFLPVIILDNHYSKHTQQSDCFEYLIIDNKKETPKCYSYTAKVIGYYDYKDKSFKKCKGKIKLYILKDIADKLPTQDLQYGDILVSKNKMMPINNTNQIPFNYKRYMRHQRIYDNVFLSSYELVDTGKGNPIIRLAKQTNLKLQNRINQTSMKKDNKSLAKAMLLGDKNDLPIEVRQSFNISGLAHILCVSGLHIMMIISAFVYVIKILLPKKKISIYITNLISILLAWSIAFIVGCTPSSMRVAFMVTMLIASKFTTLNNDRLNILLVTAFVFLLFDPLLLFNISFQLSFLAMLGIITLQRPLYNILGKHIHRFCPNLIISNASTTTASQIFTLPVIVINFSRFPVFFLLTNLIVVPFMQIILISLLVLLIVADITPLEYIASKLCDLQLSILLFIAHFTDMLTNLL